MKYIFSIITITLLLSCGSDDEAPTSNLTYLEAGIQIVKQDGSPLDPSDCIDPTGSYAVRISVNPEGMGEITPTNVAYTVNGNTSSVTFTTPEDKIINIEIVPGLNTVQLVNSGITDTVRQIAPSEFEIVT
ncbi:MAG: hypothetical protein ACSHW7_10120 [Patiriisocius sp.]|uniref:hypothetical protein n=1 Tax=Patiriisocius sp. TaxID=2822396 RepID=UPI003EF21FEA